MRLLICDRNRLLGEALAAALAARDHELTAVTVTTADECIAAAGSYSPHVCVLGVRLPETADGLRLISVIRSRFPGTAVVVCDASDPATLAPDTLAEARKLGITGFLARSRSVSEMAEALRRIASGQPVFDPVPRPSPRPARPFVLTPREAEVLHRIAAGQHTEQMAGEMNIAVSTLRTYMKNVFAKIGVHSRLEAAAVARRANLPGGITASRLSPEDRQDDIPSL